MDGQCAAVGIKISMHKLPQMAVLLRVEKLRISNALLLKIPSGLSSETRMLTNIMLFTKEDLCLTQRMIFFHQK